MIFLIKKTADWENQIEKTHLGGSNELTNMPENDCCLKQSWHILAIIGSTTLHQIRDRNESCVKFLPSCITGHDSLISAQISDCKRIKHTSCHQTGASSRSLDPTGHLCCPTQSPPHTPEVLAAAPFPNLLIHLDIKGRKYYKQSHSLTEQEIRRA